MRGVWQIVNPHNPGVTLDSKVATFSSRMSVFFGPAVTTRVTTQGIKRNSTWPQKELKVTTKISTTKVAAISSQMGEMQQRIYPSCCCMSITCVQHDSFMCVASCKWKSQHYIRSLHTPTHTHILSHIHKHTHELAHAQTHTRYDAAIALSTVLQKHIHTHTL